jgi:signal transduction histidine kinase
VSNVSHELKTPLTTIRMYAELLGDNRVRDEARQRNYLDTIIIESQRLTRLVNNVLDFSRLEQGHKQYNSEEGDLVPLISRVLETQRPRLEEAGFKLEANLPAGDPIRIYADRDAIEQVLLNLLDNAMKYASSGGWLGLSLQRNGADAILTVSDHGPGVPSAHRRRIFDTFHRVDDSLTASQPGSGLGLSIARRLLRDQGGDLRCEPNQPAGAKFIATIPLAE